MKTAFITGVTGQDGAYLSDYLLSIGYNVTGLYRPGSARRTVNLERGVGNGNILTKQNFRLVEGDVLDPHAMREIVSDIEPDEIYHLAAPSFVGSSFSNPSLVMDVIYKGFVNVVSAVSAVNPDVPIYNASTSEMFGNHWCVTLNENSKMLPVSPYGIAKLAAYNYGTVKRKGYGMAISNGILFNHESPLRGDHFVTQKIIKGLMKYRLGYLEEPIMLGNITAERDWGFAGDYVKGMQAMLQVAPDDFVLATGKTFSVNEFINMVVDRLFPAGRNNGKAFKWLCDDYGANYALYCGNEKVIVTYCDEVQRPLDIEYLCGDPTKAKELLNWEAEVDLKRLINIMVIAELSDAGYIP